MEIVMSLFLMLGGVGVFMHGMKQMSNGMEQSAGVGVRTLFKKISKNRLLDYGVGIGTTVIVQSSSATSIMTIGLANAGIVNTRQGSGIILGAKVGTTLTAFIFALSGLSKGSFSVSAIFAAMAFVGVIITMTSSNDSLKKVALFLTGLGLLFVGLEVMEFAIGGKESILSQQISKLFAYDAMMNPILLVLLGVLFTCIIQSSTAAVGIFIAFLKSGVLSSVDQSFFLVMGANIGTCMDGIMASFGSSVEGKRIALFHVMTSAIGAIFFSIVLVIFRSPIVNMFNRLFALPEWSLAVFNLSYNVIYTLALLCALTPLVKLCTKIIKDSEREEQRLTYVDQRLLATPTLAVEQTLKEVYDLAALAQQNLDRAFHCFLDEDMSQSKKIASDEYRIDYVTEFLANYIVQVSSKSISYANEKLLGGLHHVITDIERIGDHAVLFAKETNFMKQNDIHLLEETKTEIKQIYNKITYVYALSLITFKTRKTDKLKEISQLQKEIEAMIADEKGFHTKRLNSGEYSVEVSKTLYAVLLSMQRVTDHLINLAFSIRSNTGSKTETFKKLEKEKREAEKKDAQRQKQD